MHTIEQPARLVPPTRTGSVGEPGSASAAPALDESQAAAIDAALTHQVTIVTGAPGTGKTATAVALATEQLVGRGLDPAGLLVLAATRRGAAGMRDELARRAARTVGQPLVRTMASAAFGVLHQYADAVGLPAPTLISGPEQDLLLAELLEGHLDGDGSALELPSGVPIEALRTRGFRDELRDVVMRAAERGIDPLALDGLGVAHDRPAWRLCARLYEEYRDVTVLQQLTPDVGPRYDPAVVVDAALEALGSWEVDLPGVPRPGWRHVVVDDYQEATAASARFLRFCVDAGSRLTLFADPDLAVQSFRGAVPRLVGAAPAARSTEGAAAELGAHEVVLGTVWRHGPAIRAVTGRVAQRIGSVGAVRHRHATADREQEDVARADVALLASPAQEHAYIAHALRSEHLFARVPWSRMAVIARSGAQVGALRRALASASVPVSVLRSDGALRDEPAVRPLLTALDAVAGGGTLTPEAAVELLLSPLGGLDAVSLRRLRRALRTEELASGGGRSSDVLLAEVLADPVQAAGLPAGVRRGAQRLALVLEQGRAAFAEPDANAQTVLWAVWEASRLATRWRSAALAGGAGGQRADRDLDAVLALFKAAERFVERFAGSSVRQFVEYVRSQELPADSLAAHGGASEAVSVLTPAGAAGREWDVVVVAGVQEGVWPDLRLRDSLLGAQALVEVHAARQVAQQGGDARRLVLADEVRSFLMAVSRARRRLLVTAVQDAETSLSPLVDLVEPPPLGEDDAPDPRLREVPGPLDLRGVVGAARRRLERRVEQSVAVADAEALALADLLAGLAVADVPAADPRTWYHANPLSSSSPAWPEDSQVRVSPSKVESVTTCGLRWALETAGGRASEALSQSLGNLVHSIAEELPDADARTLRARLDERWPELGLPAGWPATMTRRKAERMVERLAAYFAGVDQVVATEAPFRLEIGRAILSGTVDRIARDAAGIHIDDLKTGSSVPSKGTTLTNPQLGSYQLAVQAGAFAELPPGLEHVDARLVFVSAGANGPTLREQPSLASSPDPDWAATIVEQAAETMSRASFDARANATCTQCPVRRSCPLQPEGRRVGAPETPIRRESTRGASPRREEAS